MLDASTHPVSLDFLTPRIRDDGTDPADLANSVFVRPTPVKSAFLDAAVEPVDWTPLAEQQDRPRNAGGPTRRPPSTAGAAARVSQRRTR
jgi:hypothetical protein